MNSFSCGAHFLDYLSVPCNKQMQVIYGPEKEKWLGNVKL